MFPRFIQLVVEHLPNAMSEFFGVVVFVPPLVLSFAAASRCSFMQAASERPQLRGVISRTVVLSRRSDFADR